MGADDVGLERGPVHRRLVQVRKQHRRHARDATVGAERDRRNRHDDPSLYHSEHEADDPVGHRRHRARPLGRLLVRPADDASPPASITLSSWLDPIDAAGFDGIELWERHLTAAEPDEATRVLDHPLSIDVFNSYVSLDDPDPVRSLDGHASGSAGPAAPASSSTSATTRPPSGAYAERIAAWIDELPPTTALLCECHHGISIAEDPATAAAIFDAAGPADRLQAIVHTHEDPDHLRRRFDTYGDRITHVHVNFLDFASLSAPRLRDIRSRVESQVTLLRSLGFDGSWTIEFSHGVLSDHDEPGYLLEQAASDLDVLRDVLA